jgi:IS5 family transposase
MYEQRTRRVDNRIVSISQPQVGPIVRGKAASKTEFGAKLSVSHVHGGYVLLDKLSWDAYNESGDLITQVETYKKRFGHYPASVHADEIYRTQGNRRYCKQKSIRLSGRPLGRPRKQTAENKAELKALREQIHQDELDRIPIESKFGNAKRKGTLARIMAKLPHTSVSVINIGLIVLNLDKRLREVLLCLINQSFECGLRLRMPDGYRSVNSESSRWNSIFPRLNPPPTGNAA